MDKCKHVIETTSLKLLTEHGVTQRTIFNWIRDSMKEHVAHMPRVRVLYNAQHGGYGYSDKFKHFIAAQKKLDKESDEYDLLDYVEDNRVDHVKYIVPFAQYMLHLPMMEGLTDVLREYKSRDYNSIFNSANNLHRLQKDYDTFVRNIENLKSYLQCSKSVYAMKESKYAPCVRYLLDSDNPDFKLYTKDQLQKVLQSVTNTNESSVDKKKAKISELREKLLSQLGKEEFDSIMKFLVDYDSIYKISSFEDRVRDEKVFSDALLTHGYTEPTVWKHQQFYNMKAISYLISRKNDIKNISAPDDNGLYETFGLACASDKYCKLAIAEVPALMEWYIAEYDGLEEVCIE